MRASPAARGGCTVTEPELSGKGLQGACLHSDPRIPGDKPSVLTAPHPDFVHTAVCDGKEPRSSPDAQTTPATGRGHFELIYCLTTIHTHLD